MKTNSYNYFNLISTVVYKETKCRIASKLLNNESMSHVIIIDI